MTAVPDQVDIVVEAPDGAAALELVHRLEHLGSVSADERWTVTLRNATDRAAAERAVRAWLIDIGAPSAIVRVGRAERVVGAREPPRATSHHLATNRDFIG